VILKDTGGANPVTLVNGTDYTISYKNNLKKRIATMTFTANPASGYSGSFKSYVIVSSKTEQAAYTGSQVKPKVTVYFGGSEAVKQAKKAGEVRESVLTDKAGEYKLTKLDLKENGIGDYTLAYGNNVTAGKNKGSVTVNGVGLYGGKVTVKFTILGKDVHKK